MKPDVNGTPNTFELALIPAFSRQNGRRGKNPRPRLRGRGWHGVPGEGLAAGYVTASELSAGAAIDCQRARMKSITR
ncbi:hypothetical protein A6X21_00180 [Planctopirus hydrillae]|uniref:Uncharacterized protein n=1 Tax=Planctopirus hydrillae TaxID=1841610 RepID=A0A1C3EAW0_9PLAN|nr:hypothetical protein A6X21_00180 [Planctopirus hydrillae]